MRRQKKHETNHIQNMEQYNRMDTNGKLIINLRDLSHVMRFLYEGKGSQKRVLIVLNDVGTITQRELTERLGIQPGSASEVIAKLENAGLIVRTASEADRRTADISLTEEGKKMAVEAMEQRNRRHEEMFSCLSEDEKTQLLSVLEKINDDWLSRYQDAAEKKDAEDHHHGSRGGDHGHHNHRGRSQRAERRG